jgi:ribonuclease Z
MRVLKFSLIIFALISWHASIFAASDNADPSGDDTMKITFLGTGAPRPSMERYGPSILVEAGDRRIIVDAGSGMRERLFEAGGFELISGVDHILVTHLHFDHTVSIPGIWLSGWLYGRRVPLKVQGPMGTEASMENILKAYEWDIAYRVVVGVPLAGSELEASDVSPGIIYEQDGLKITAFDVEHMPIDMKTGELLDFEGQTFGYRIDYKGHSVVFSGDTRSTEKSNLNTVGEGVDLLIHEVQVPSPGNSKEAELANVSLSVHSTPEQASLVFERTKPKMAVYSHIIPPETTSEQLHEYTRPFYKGPLTVAHDFMEITLVGDRIIVGERTREGSDVFEKSSVLTSK